MAAAPDDERPPAVAGVTPVPPVGEKPQGTPIARHSSTGSPMYYAFASDESARSVVAAASEAYVSLQSHLEDRDSPSSEASSAFPPLFRAKNADLTRLEQADVTSQFNSLTKAEAIALLRKLTLQIRSSVQPTAEPAAGSARRAARSPSRAHHHHGHNHPSSFRGGVGGGAGGAGSRRVVASREPHGSFRLATVSDGDDDHNPTSLAIGRRAVSADSLRGSPLPGEGTASPLPHAIAASPFLGGIAASFRRVHFTSAEYSEYGSPADDHPLHPVGSGHASQVEEFRHLVRQPSENPNDYAVADDEDDDVVGSSINGYVLLGDLGQGSFGRVMLGCHTETDEIVAIKIVHKSLLNRERRRALLPSSSTAGGAPQPNQDPAVSGIRREIAVMKKLHHKHLVKLRAVVDDPGADRLYLVMQYVPHGPFLKRKAELRSFHRVDPLPETKARRYSRQLISALRHLHQHNIVHRDVKPENILRGDNDMLFLADFGVSEIVDDLGVSRQVIGTHGTPAFWPPEMYDDAASVEVDGVRQDEWGLSVTIYLMLSGRLPFEGSNFNELGESIRHDRLIVPDDISHHARDFLRRALDRDVHQRLTLDGMRRHPFIVGPRPSRVRDKLQGHVESAVSLKSDDNPKAADRRSSSPTAASGHQHANTAADEAATMDDDANAITVINPPSGQPSPPSRTHLSPTGNSAEELTAPGSRAHHRRRSSVDPDDLALMEAVVQARVVREASSTVLKRRATGGSGGGSGRTMSPNSYAEALAAPIAGIQLAESQTFNNLNFSPPVNSASSGASPQSVFHESPRPPQNASSSGSPPVAFGVPAAAGGPSPTPSSPPPEVALTLEPAPTGSSPTGLGDDCVPPAALMSRQAGSGPGSLGTSVQEAASDESPVGPNFQRLTAIAAEHILTPNHSRAAARAAMMKRDFSLMSPSESTRAGRSSFGASVDREDDDSLSDFDDSSPFGSGAHTKGGSGTITTNTTGSGDVEATTTGSPTIGSSPTTSGATRAYSHHVGKPYAAAAAAVPMDEMPTLAGSGSNSTPALLARTGSYSIRIARRPVASPPQQRPPPGTAPSAS